MAPDERKVGEAFTRWRDEAGDMARALRGAASIGTVLMKPEVAERIAAMLLEAEPPGTGAQQIRAGYQAGLEALRTLLTDIANAHTEGGKARAIANAREKLNPR